MGLRAGFKWSSAHQGHLRNQGGPPDLLRGASASTEADRVRDEERGWVHVGFVEAADHRDGAGHVGSLQQAIEISLCNLKGQPLKDATQQLGWPQETLAGRLAARLE
jgi:hypothetical protein